MDEDNIDDLARRIARWLAPYVAAELQAGVGSSPADAVAEAKDGYDGDACREYVTTLGEGVLERAAVFFGALADDGEVDSQELARLLGIDSPRYIAANLTNSLKQRADALGFERPWHQAEDAERTIWADRDGIAVRMAEAIAAERRSRRGRHTQRVTAADAEAGRIRVPARNKALFPDHPGHIQLDLLGQSTTCRWNPRSGQDKSGVLSVGRPLLSELLADGRLRIGDSLLIERDASAYRLFDPRPR